MNKFYFKKSDNGSLLWKKKMMSTKLQDAKLLQEKVYF